MAALKLIEEARSAGLKLRADGDRLVIRGPKSAEPIAKALLDRKAEILPFLRELPAPVAPLSSPHINARGEIIIPFECDPKYHWWAGGQSIRETLRELHASAEVLARYLESDLTVRQ